MKKYFLAFLTTFIFSSFALAEDESKSIVEHSNSTIDLTSNTNKFEYPPNIDELINTLGKRDSFTITIPKDADYTSKGISNFSKTRIISKTELKDAIKLEIDSSRTFQNYMKPTIYNETFTVKYNKYSIEYMYSSGYVVQVSLIINNEINPNIEHLNGNSGYSGYYWNKIPKLLINNGFVTTCLLNMESCSKYKKGDTIAKLDHYSPNISQGIERFSIIFTNPNVTKEAEESIKNNFDDKQSNRELERIFRKTP